jgi:hypothetical protein
MWLMIYVLQCVTTNSDSHIHLPLDLHLASYFVPVMTTPKFYLRSNQVNLYFFNAMLSSVMGDHDQRYIELAPLHPEGPTKSLTLKGVRYGHSRTIIIWSYSMQILNEQLDAFDYGLCVCKVLLLY